MKSVPGRTKQNNRLSFLSRNGDISKVPRKPQVDVAKCHACHARRRGDHGNPLRHQSPPSAVSATPETQSAGGCVDKLCEDKLCEDIVCVWGHVVREQVVARLVP